MLFRSAGLQAHALAGIGAWPTPDAVVLDTPRAVQALPGFAEGWWSVQDAGAQLAAPLLEIEPGMRVLDACAAPGGKACHLLERCSDIDLVALDVQASRLRRVRENLDRLGLHATVIEGDASAVGEWWDARQFDAILVDAPCSGTGVMRRHPDIKVLRRPGQIREAIVQQSTILMTAWLLLREGGRLLYATCSVLPDENEEVIGAFLRLFPEAIEQPIDIPGARRLEHGTQLLPRIGGNDGFYYALLQKPRQ